MRARIKGGPVLALGTRLGAGESGTGQVLSRRFIAGLQGGEVPLQRDIAGGDLGCIEVIEFQGLFQDKEVFGLPVPGQGFDDFFFGGFASGVTEAGQRQRIALPRDHGAQDR